MRTRAALNTKSSIEADTKRARRKEGIPGPVVRRVTKKLAKVMYLQQKPRTAPGEVCARIANCVEAFIQRKSVTFEDYKRKVVFYLQLVQKTPQLVATINRNFENDALEGWLAGELPDSQ
jgi:hypothetical protein